MNSVVARTADKPIPHLTVRSEMIPASAGARTDGRFASKGDRQRLRTDKRDEPR